MKEMSIGQLRHRIEIGRYVESRGWGGDPQPPQWQPVAQVWAAVEALTGGLYMAGQQLAEQVDHRVTIRWRAGLEPGMIVRHGDRELRIQAVLDREGRRRWLELMCREVRPA